MPHDPMVSLRLSELTQTQLLRLVWRQNNELLKRTAGLEQFMTDSTADLQEIAFNVHNISTALDGLDADTSSLEESLVKIEQLLNDDAETAAVQAALAESRDIAARVSTTASNLNTASTHAADLLPAEVTEPPQEPPQEPPTEEPPVEEPPAPSEGGEVPPGDGGGGTSGGGDPSGTFG